MRTRPDQRLRHSRRYRRRTLRVMVEYSSPTGLHRDPATTLGAGGLFIETESPLRENSPIKLRFQLSSSAIPHEIEGRVVWRTDGRSDGSTTPGMGIEFTDRGASKQLARELEHLGEIRELVDLGVEEPRVEGEAMRRQAREALPKRRLGQHVRWRRGVRAPDLFARMPRRGVAYAAEAIRARRDVRLQHLVYRRAEQQVRVADDAGAGPHCAVTAACALRGDALHELGLANGPERLPPLGAVHGAALHEDGLLDAVGPRVLQELVQQVAAPRVVPEVMVRIADSEIPFEGLLFSRRQPCLLGRGAGDILAEAGHRVPRIHQRVDLLVPEDLSRGTACGQRGQHAGGGVDDLG